MTKPRPTSNSNIYQDSNSCFSPSHHLLFSSLYRQLIDRSIDWLDRFDWRGMWIHDQKQNKTKAKETYTPGLDFFFLCIFFFSILFCFVVMYLMYVHTYIHTCGLDLTGPEWTGLNWIGMEWIGLDCNYFLSSFLLEFFLSLFRPSVCHVYLPNLHCWNDMKWIRWMRYHREYMHTYIHTLIQTNRSRKKNWYCCCSCQFCFYSSYWKRKSRSIN